MITTLFGGKPYLDELVPLSSNRFHSSLSSLYGGRWREKKMKILSATRKGSGYVAEFSVIDCISDLSIHPPMGVCFEKPKTYELGTLEGYYEINKDDLSDISFNKPGTSKSRRIDSLILYVRGQSTPNTPA